MSLKEEILILLNEKKNLKATERVVEELLKNYKIHTIRHDVKSEMWIYQDGVFVPEGKTHIKEIIRKILDYKFSSQFVNNIISKIEADTYISEKEFFSSVNKDEIPLKNGVLNLDTKELREYSTNDVFFHKIPVEYNPESNCPEINKHFEKVLKNPDDKKVLYEIIGYCLERTHFIEKAFMFVGDGRNGKSKTLELIKRFVGAENCASVPLVSMKEDSFHLWQLFQKLVNLAGDLDNQSLKNTGLFKSLTGRDTITAHRKFLPDLIFVNTAKNIFACNELPKVYDLSKGFWSRWILLEFPFEFVSLENYKVLPEEEKEFRKIADVDIIEKLTIPAELSGLLNEALKGLERLRLNKDFSYSIGVQEIKDFWIRKSNSFTAFCMDCLEESEGSWVSKADVRRTFNKYCKKFRLRGCGDREIKATLEDLFGVVDSRREDVWGWENVKSKECKDKFTISKNVKNEYSEKNIAKVTKFENDEDFDLK